MEIHGGKKRETGAGKNLSEGAKNKKSVGPVSGYFKAGKTFFGGIRLGTEEPRQFEGGFKPFGGFRRPLRSFYSVFWDIFLSFLAGQFYVHPKAVVGFFFALSGGSCGSGCQYFKAI